MKITESPTRVPLDDSLIDRLVDGELGEAERACLLRQLDGDPDGWKRCALAFLEAQAWRDAFPSETAVAPRERSDEPRPRGIRPQRLAAIAAAVMVAFLTGFLARGPGLRSGGNESAPTLAHVAPSPGPSNSAPAVPAAVSAVPEYLRQQMERQGYQVEGQMKVVPVALDDGRRVALPVEKVSLRYVGQRIH